MDIAEKLMVLADAAKYDASCSSSGSKRTRPGKGLGSTEGNGICHSYTPDGRCISLLKILMTNSCIFDCQYCINRASSGVKRARFTTDEVVNLTLDFYRRNYIEGLFLSSGIIRDSDYTMEQMIKIAQSLREMHNFRGYIHLKAIPGASDELITRAGFYADRISVNIELPTRDDLSKLAPEKDRDSLEANMADVRKKAQEIYADRKKGMKAPIYNPAGQTTQMIVGATQTADKDILLTSDGLYKTHKLRRVYYSAFSPIPHADDRLPPQKPPLMREHRLYQADWMMRFYGFEANEIVSDDAPDLDLAHDPKTSWALRNRGFFPIDVNAAPREHLLRIPGMGVQSVNKVIQIRRHTRVTLRDLTILRVAMNRARPFVITDDYRPVMLADQMELSGIIRPAPIQMHLPL